MPNYRMRMAADKTAEILIYDDIGQSGFFAGGISAKDFAEDLKALGQVGTLKIRVNSPGGDVFDALAIYNTLRRHPARKEVSVDGMALSAASIVIMAGDHIAMAESAMLMIHDPWSVSMGSAADMRAQADLLDQVKENLVVVYARRTKRDGEDIRQMMTDETWMRAGQAFDEGFIDDITGELAVAAKFDPDRFKNVPPEIRRQMQAMQAKTPRLDVVRARLQEYTARAPQPVS